MAADKGGLVHGHQLDEQLSGLGVTDGLMTVAGFGSLLSERSARSTFPDLRSFRVGRRQIANAETGEISSLSCEECPGQEIVVSLFEVESTPSSRAAFVEREHEFRFVAVQTELLDGTPTPNLAVLCAAWNDEAYKSTRCPPDEFQRRYGTFGIDRVWRRDVLPCRAYLRHCVLAAKNLGDAAYDSFMDHTYLADRQTTIRTYMRTRGDIMELQLPPELAARYGG